jgi:hypothetical protein
MKQKFKPHFKTKEHDQAATKNTVGITTSGHPSDTPFLLVLLLLTSELTLQALKATTMTQRIN